MSKDKLLFGHGVKEMRGLRTSEIQQPTISFRIPTAQEEWARSLYYYDKSDSFMDREIFHHLRLPTKAIYRERATQIGGWSTLGGYKEPNSAFTNFYRYTDPILRITGSPQISPTELTEVGQFFMDQVYPKQRDLYNRYLEDLEADRTLFEEQVFPRFQSMHQQWGFVIPSRGYEVVLTLWGTEGSYQSKTNPGTVTVPPFKARRPWVGFQSNVPSSRFSNNQLLTNTIHELLHIGVQDPVVDQFALTQSEKELVIDWMCQRGFGDLLPDYTTQDDYASPHNYDPKWARVRKLHRHLLDNGRIDNLPQTVSDFINSNH